MSCGGVDRYLCLHVFLMHMHALSLNCSSVHRLKRPLAFRACGRNICRSTAMAAVHGCMWCIENAQPGCDMCMHGDRLPGNALDGADLWDEADAMSAELEAARGEEVKDACMHACMPTCMGKC